MRRLLWLVLLAAAPAALAAGQAGPSPIVVGTVDSAYTRGAQAYVAYVNRRGGVNGRRIVLRVLAGDPVEASRRLVEDDGVLALFGTGPTAVSLAIRDVAETARVPQLFVRGGAAVFGRDAVRHSWTIGFEPAYALEARTLASQLAKTRPAAPVSVLYSDDADGRELLGAFRRAMPRAQVSTSVADLPRNGPLVVLSSHPLAVPAGRAVYSNAAAAVPREGAVATVVVRVPGDPRWAGDPLLRRFRPPNAEYALGLAAGFTLVDTLKHAGPAPTRSSVMAAARSLLEADNPFLLPGIVVRTGRTDGFPIQQVALERHVHGRWNVFSGPISR